MFFFMNFDIMAVGGYSNQIGLYDVPTKKLIRTLESKWREILISKLNTFFVLVTKRCQ